MAATRPTFEVDEEIVRLTRQKEQVLLDLQDPGLSERRRVTLQHWLAAVQANLDGVQVIVDGQQNTAGLSVMRIQ